MILPAKNGVYNLPEPPAVVIKQLLIKVGSFLGCFVCLSNGETLVYCCRSSFSRCVCLLLLPFLGYAVALHSPARAASIQSAMSFSPGTSAVCSLMRKMPPLLLARHLPGDS